MNKKSILPMLLLIVLILLSLVNAVWFNNDFDFRRNVTIDEGLDIQLNNTPFLLNFSILPENPNGFGEIIVVGSQSYQLPSEVVSTNEIWFNATTTLNGTAGIEIYYKKEGTNASFLPVQVWDGYIAELHFEKGPNAVLDLMVNNSANETGEGANFTSSDDDAFTTDGLFGSAYQGDNTNNFVHLNSLNGDLVNKNLTFGMWFNATANDLTISGKTLFFFQDLEEFSLRTTSNNISWTANGLTPSNHSNVPIVAGTWQHIVITMTTDTGEMYLNGTKVADLTDDVFQAALNANSNMGSDSGSTSFFNGRIDEFFIYDGILTAERINATFQMGVKNYAVLSEEEERGENVTVLLESPTVNFFSSSSTINFTCSANETNAVNLANVTFDLWDSAGAVEAETFRDISGDSSPNANESFLQSTIPDAQYAWNCFYRNTENLVGSAENRTLTIDTTIPIVNITSSLLQSSSVGINYTFTETNPNVCKFTTDGGITNTSFSSCGVNATITANGDINVSVFVSDLAGNEGSDNKLITAIGFLTEFNQSRALETSTQNFAIEITNGSAVIDSAILTYNNTEFAFGSITSNGTATTINRTVNLDLFNLLTTNQSFFWNVSVSTSTNQLNLSTSIKDQVVSQMFIGNDTNSLTSIIALNFTIRDENTNQLLNDTTISTEITTFNRTATLTRMFNFATAVNNSQRNVSNFGYTIFPDFAFLTANAIIQYAANGYDTREFHLSNYNLNATQSTAFTLLLALSDLTEAITINVQDENGNVLEGVIVEAHKEDLTTGNFSIVDVQQTNPDGRAEFQLIRGDNSYKFIFIIDGIVKLETSSFKLIDTEYFFTVTIGEPVTTDILIDIGSITDGLTFNTSGCNDFIFSWDDQSNVAENFTLRVFNVSFLNGTLQTFSQTSTNTSGIIIYRIGNSTCTPFIGEFRAQSFVSTTKDLQEHALNTLYVIIRAADAILPEGAARDGLLFGAIVVITFFGVGMVSQNPVVYILLGLMGLWVMVIPNFITISTASILTLALIGIFFAWKLKT